MSFCVLYWVVEVLYIYIYIFKVQIWKKKMYLLLTSYLCLNQNENIAYWCFLTFIPQLLTKILTFTFWSHVWRGNSRDCLCPQGFRDGKEIYIYTHTHTHSHRMLWWVLWACNLCIEFRRAFQRKNVSTKSWRWSRIFPDKLLDLILLGEKSLCEFFFSLLMPWKAFLKFMSLPKYILKIKIKSYVFLNNFLKI